MALSCRGVAPILAASPSAVDFGDVPVGDSGYRSLVVTNVGDAATVVSGASDPGRPFTVDVWSEILAPGQSTFADLYCAPTTVGTFTARVTIVGSGGASRTVPLSCRGVAPVVSTATTLGFSDLLVGQAETRQLGVTNTGTAPLILHGVTVSGAAFTGGLGSPITVPPGASTALAVTCTPPAAGEHLGTLTLQHNALGGVTTVALTCRGFAGRLTWHRDPIYLTPGQWTPVTVENTGVGPLAIWSVAFSENGFETAPMILPWVLAPGETLTWNATCTGKEIWSKHYAVHDGLSTGSALAECGTWWPWDPPPVEMSSVEPAPLAWPTSMAMASAIPSA